MINSYNLSHKNPLRLIILHGLNNNRAAFTPLREYFDRMGWETVLVTLPCHGEKRNEAQNFKEAFACFNRSMLEVTDRPYAVIAFSHGGLYLQLWMEKEPHKRPLAQVLLAPALYIRRQNQIEKLIGWLPDFFPIKSLSPSKFKRYQILTIGEYRILIDGMKAYQKLGNPVRVPSLMVMDPKDELVDAGLMKTKFGEKLEFVEWPREYLKSGLGRHHILFHPEYFSGDDWKRFLDKIESFFISSCLA